MTDVSEWQKRHLRCCVTRLVRPTAPQFQQKKMHCHCSVQACCSILGFYFRTLILKPDVGSYNVHRSTIERYASIKLHSDQQRSRGRNRDSRQMLIPSSHGAPFWNNLFYLLNRVVLLSVISAWLWSPMHNQLSLPSTVSGEKHTA